MGEVIGKYDGHVTLLKEIGADETLANVILVLSDADAVFAMPNDRDRQNQIWVEDLDEPGAHAYLDTLDVLPCDYLNELELPPCDRSSTPSTHLALRNKLFFESGTRVMTLTSAAETQALSSFSLMLTGTARGNSGRWCTWKTSPRSRAARPSRD